MNSKRLLRLLGGLAATALVPLAEAQDTPSLPLPSMEQLQALSLEELLDLEITSSTKTIRRVVDTPSVASVVDRQTIRNYGWLSIQEILSRQPGFYVGQVLERTTVSNRGMYENWANNHTALLIDGVPFNDPFNQSALTWEVTPVFLVESLEVVRGPGSALYGSSAVNSVVNVNSVKAPTHGNVRLEATARAGTYGRQVYDVLAGVDTEPLSAVITFNFDRDAGNRNLSFDLSGRVGADGVPLRFPVRDDRESSYFFTKLEAKGVLRGFSLQLHRQDWEMGPGVGSILIHDDSLRGRLDYARSILSLAYRTPDPRSFRQEYVLQLQRFDVDILSRPFPDGAVLGFYPAGVTEQIVGHYDQAFLRAQLTYQPSPQSFSFVGGAEYSRMLGMAQRHSGNIDFSRIDPTFGLPAPLASVVQLPPILPGLYEGAPQRLGAFAQATSGRFLRGLFEVTAGLRYDYASFNFRDATDTADPVRTRSYQQVSPRLALVAFPTERLSLKAMAGRAFREPALAETMLSNSFLGIGSPSIKPETFNSYELAADWRPLDNINARLNGYVLQSQNLIGYDAFNVSYNVFSRRTAGLEAELLWTYRLGRAGSLSGFANYSYTQILDETSADPTFRAPSPNQLTWAPHHSAKLGASWQYWRVGLAAQLFYQGEVERRASDLAVPAYNALRPRTVDDWTNLDLTASFQILSWLTARVKASNLLNTHGQAIGGAIPLDYRTRDRRVMAFLEVRL